MKKLVTFLKPATTEINLVVEEEVFDLYQHFLKLIQRAFAELVLSKDVSALFINGVYTEQQCISIEVFGSFNLPKFTLNIYLFQLVSCFNNKSMNIFELNIRKFEDDVTFTDFVKGAIISKTAALKKGLYSEKLISDVLTDLKKEKKILSFYKSSMIDDISGIDYFFSMRNYKNMVEEIPFQVKSSSSSQERHEKKFGKIPSIVVSMKTSSEDLKNRIILIGEAYVSYRKSILHL